ncbi:unnamed protein product [Cyclocybe aegerita]|uniref:Uncharacterized protein n=1 Tax=Cyclocybe aegerita TaxID=1973307 RepID=A0A8S0W2Y8_CYCAE|nr:unnamed protein product [Cyclocybe aegerita]
MLTLRPLPPLTPRDFSMAHRRGRSRQVSSTALARQASEERRFLSCDAMSEKWALPPPVETERTQQALGRAHDTPFPNRPTQPDSSPSLSKHSVNTHHSSSIHTTHIPSDETIIPIVSPLPMRAAYAPPFMRSESPSPPSSASMSPDYYDSPPSPPRSLEDQVHVAYALDDIHLAKILLLRLKGIEVTSDDDPRIAAVQDEDFDFCFVPNGRLMDDRDEMMVKEMQAREVERIEECRRLERLRTCERKWEDEKRRMREERLAVLRRRERRRLEEEERKRRKEEQERRRAAEEERRRAAKAAEIQRAAQRSRARVDRKVVSYEHLSNAANTRTVRQQDHFVYDFMPASSSSRAHKPRTSPSPSVPIPLNTRPIFPAQTFDDSCSIPFTDVLRSMEGALFPITNEERIQRQRCTSPVTSRSRSRTHSQPKQQRRDALLLNALLADIQRSDEERKNRKGKQPAEPRRPLPCLACSSTSPLSSPTSTISSSSSSSVPRTSSWLSFRGVSSASSSSTDLTTPSSSPISTPKSAWFISSRPKSWMSGSGLSDSFTSSPPRLRHSCRPRTRSTPIALADGPLPLPQPVKTAPISYPGRQRSTSQVRAAKEGAGALARRMSKFVELARGFQNAYVTVALFSVAASCDSFDDRDPLAYEADSAKQDTLAVAQAPRPKLRPAGSRASVQDVAKFLCPVAPAVASSSDERSSSPSHDTSAPCEPLPRYIQLTCPFPPTAPPRTPLPDPLPYKLHFQPIPTPTRSPFRFHALSELHTMYPASEPEPCLLSAGVGQITWRIRSVGNPAYLRLKALHNVVWRRGVKWEGCGRETALGGGRERVVGVAYEGVGRSLLSRGSGQQQQAPMLMNGC